MKAILNLLFFSLLSMKCALAQTENLFLFFNEVDSLQQKWNYTNAVPVFSYKIDRNPYVVDFRFERENVEVDIPECEDIKDINWLNKHYGWKNNIEFLRGNYLFNEKYQSIYLVILPSKRVVEVFDFTLRSHR